mmetsp:Transcript_66993/g.112366  ORF Transcript_66993/g.112366 Transcript_66993/m.112366 type:complete len:326 (+) Transcript_66993:435-1412(+)
MHRHDDPGALGPGQQRVLVGPQLPHGRLQRRPQPRHRARRPARVRGRRGPHRRGGEAAGRRGGRPDEGAAAGVRPGGQQAEGGHEEGPAGVPRRAGAGQRWVRVPAGPAQHPVPRGHRDGAADAARDACGRHSSQAAAQPRVPRGARHRAGGRGRFRARPPPARRPPSPGGHAGHRRREVGAGQGPDLPGPAGQLVLRPRLGAAGHHLRQEEVLAGGRQVPLERLGPLERERSGDGGQAGGQPPEGGGVQGRRRSRREGARPVPRLQQGHEAAEGRPGEGSREALSVACGVRRARGGRRLAPAPGAVCSGRSRRRSTVPVITCAA